MARTAIFGLVALTGMIGMSYGQTPKPLIVSPEKKIEVALVTDEGASMLDQQPPLRACPDSLEPRDQAGIKEVIGEYRAAWLRGDPGGVLQTFTDSSVLLPAGGADPVIGIGKIKEYWWPKGAPETKILQLDISVDQIEGDGCFAFARGSDNVACSTLDGGNLTRTRHRGRYLNAMQKMPDGSWRILQHMWDDEPNETF